ncbi:MAG: ABC transporter substrate-binding protein [Spirochaetaceae bacterium]|jgi:ABC-type nitrate/sulfonate/bicarbonate transport system substrate-binding protein|nr:ABC transporter substrate-binding protein [Spirochaetaceae bacterium]
MNYFPTVKLRAALFAAAVVVFLFAGCQKKEAAQADFTPIRVVLDWTPNTNHTGLYAADAWGFYAEEGLSVEILSPPADGALALVGSGKAEFGIDFQESLGEAVSSDTPLPVKAVAAIISHNTSGIVSLESAGIKTAKDLEGKRFATWDEEKYRRILQTLMTPYGGDSSLVRYVPGDVTDVASALATTIDAVCVYEAWDVAKLKLDGLAINYIDIGKSDKRLDHYTPIIAANETFLRESPETARKFMRATAKGYRYAIENPAEAAALLVEAVPELDPALVEASALFLASQYQGDSPAWGFIDGERWADYYRWAYENEVLPVDLGQQGFTNEFLP